MKPSRKPARPKNLPNERSTMSRGAPAVPASAATLTSGATSANASSTISIPPCRLSESCSASSRARSTMRPSGLLGLTIVRQTARSRVRAHFVEPDRLRQRAGARPRVGVRSVRRPDDDRRSQIHDLRQEPQRAFGARGRNDARGIVDTERCGGERFEARELSGLRQSIACALRSARRGIGARIDARREIDPRLRHVREQRARNAEPPAVMGEAARCDLRRAPLHAL